MKKLLIALIGAFAASAAHPVFAGPDWQFIEQARTTKAARMQQQAVQQPTTKAQACKEASNKIVLPLDHGLRPGHVCKHMPGWRSPARKWPYIMAVCTERVSDWRF